MRISVVIPGWPRDEFANGIVTASAHLLPALSRHGGNVVGLAWEGRASARGEGPEVAIIPAAVRRRAVGRITRSMEWALDPESTGRRQAARRVAGLLERMGGDSSGDVLEAEESFGWLAEVHRESPVTTAIALHGPWLIHGRMAGEGPQSAAYRARVKAEGEAMHRADLVLAPSEAVLRACQRHYALRPKRSCIIPYAFSPKPGRRPWSRATRDPDHLLFVGRFDRHKGGDVVLEAFALAARKIESLRLTFVGADRGVRDSSGHLWSLEEYAEARLPGCMRKGQLVWSRQLTSDQIDALRLNAAAVLSCSRWENLSLAVIEAMMLGCPVVVADRGGLPEHVTDGVTGLLFRSGSAEHLSECIVDLVSKPDKAERLGASAAAYARRAFDPESVAVRRLEAYADAVRSKQRSTT